MIADKQHISISHWGMFPLPEDIMDNFKTLVMEMRTAQKQYFKTKSDDWLRAAKEAESKVDAALHRDYTGEDKIV